LESVGALVVGRGAARSRAKKSNDLARNRRIVESV